MRRLLAHPALRWLLPVAALVWVVAVTLLNDQRNRGFLPSLVSMIIPSPRSLYCYFGNEQIQFFTNDDGSVGVAARDCDLGQSSKVQNAVFAVAHYDWGWTRRYGLVHTPVSTRKSSTGIHWINNAPLGTPMTNNDLEATLAPFRTIMVKPSPTDKEKSELEHLGLNYSTVMLAQLPLISSSKTHLGLDATQLAGELAFYVLVIWWLLALRYARKLWPKPDNSRCRHCKYPTAGLTTPTCPECGNHTQTHGS